MDINFEGAELLSQAAAQARASELNEPLDEEARALRRWEAVENPAEPGQFAVVLISGDAL